MIKEKIDTFIDLIGTEVTINNNSVKILMRVSGSSELRNYLDDVEYLAVIKPGYFITFSSDSLISENDRFTLNGRNYTIKKINSVMFKNSVIYKTAVAY